LADGKFLVESTVFQLGFDKDRVQLADGGHFYAWPTFLGHIIEIRFFS